MPILAATNLTLIHGHHTVLDAVSLSIEPHDRIGIVGRNGAGKSTLIKLLAGVTNVEIGEVSLQRGARLGYLDQHTTLDPTDTVWSAAARAFEAAHAMQGELHAVFDKMADADEDELMRLLDEQARLEEAIEAAGGLTTEHEVAKVLHGLSFVDAQFELPVSVLSGGQRARLALARLLLEEPDILLMDEPTNHLDIDGRIWLENFLADEFRGAVVLISHDRYLLDRVVDRIVEVEQARLIDYPGNYAAFRRIRADRHLTQNRAWEKQQAEFKKEEAYIRQYKAGQRSKQAKGRESRLDRAKEEALERPIELAELRVSLPKPERSGDVVVSARDITKSYPGDADHAPKLLFNELSVKIQRGERWGIVGPNGAGKTTMVRCMLGQVPLTAGQVSLGAKLDIGHFEQHRKIEDPTRTVAQHIQARVKASTNPPIVMSEQETRNLAGAFLFSGDDQDKRVSVLSGGELARADLAALMASSKNLLILDEPTNHLDIPAAERLEGILARGTNDAKTGETTEPVFPGTVILISHDRALLDAVCDHLIVLDATGKATVFAGTYSDYKQQMERAAKPAATGKPATTKPNSAPKATTKPEPKPQPKPVPQAAQPSRGPSPAKGVVSQAEKKSKFSWMPLHAIEQRMAELNAKLKPIDARLANPDVWKDAAKANRLTEERDSIRGELEDLESEWIRKSG
jgi:ATP-binding cassette, subfamily F, member 3